MQINICVFICVSVSRVEILGNVMISQTRYHHGTIPLRAAVCLLETLFLKLLGAVNISFVLSS